MPQLPMTGNILAGGRVVEGAGLDGVLTWHGTPPDGVAAVAAPTTAPTLAHSAASTSLGAGTYTVEYSYKNADGETTVGPSATVTISAGDNIGVTAAALPSGATGINVYISQAPGDAVNLKRAGTSASNTFTATAPATGAAPPTQDSTAVSGAFGGMAAPDGLLVDVTSGTYYKNTGSQAVPTWTAI